MMGVSRSRSMRGMRTQGEREDKDIVGAASQLGARRMSPILRSWYPRGAEMGELSVADRDGAEYMPLAVEALSKQAVTLAESLAKASSPGRKPNKRRIAAVSALLGELLWLRARGKTPWGYREMSAGSFSAVKGVGYKAFKASVDALARKGLITFARGHRQMVANEMTGGAVAVDWARASRFKANDELVLLAENAGVILQEIDKHYRRLETISPPADPLVLRASKRRLGASTPRGTLLTIRADDVKAAALRTRVEKLNEFLGEQIIEGCPPVYLRRVFNDGNVVAYQWNRGGRLYSVGKNSYQTIKKEIRRAIKINGEETIEIDIKASHLTVLHGLLGRDLPPRNDPYSVPGLPRPVVKRWVTMTLGHNRFHKRWSDSAIKDLSEELGCNVSLSYPIKTVRERVLRYLPILSSWENSKFDCLNLQFEESECLLSAVEELAYAYNIPSLPVHDSLIVAKENEGMAREALRRAFKSRVGITPLLS